MRKQSKDNKVREQGIEFGDLANRISNHSYPATSADFVNEYGGHQVEFPTGSQTLQEIFEPLQNDRFDSPSEVRQAIFNMVDERAIGRKYYSDRTPPVLGEKTEWIPESF